MSVKMKFGSKDIPFVYKGDKLVYPNPIKDGLLLWYDFKGMRNTDVGKEVAKDLSGNGNDGTLTNFNFTEESGYKDNTLVFDGVDDSLTIPELELDETAMTVMHDGKLYAYEDDKVLTVGEGGEIIGSGKNVLLSPQENLTVGDYHFNNSKSFIIDDSRESGYRIKYSNYERTGVSSSLYLYSPDGGTFTKDITGETISFSFWMRGNTPFMFGSKMIGTEWTLWTWTGKKTNSNNHYYITRDETLNWFEISDVKVEIGDSVTSYSPSPSDYKKTTLTPTSLTDLQLYNKTLRKNELLHNAESKGLKKLKPSVVVQDGLVLHYDFSHESNTSEYKGKAFDYSGNGNHGVLTNFAYSDYSGYQNGGLEFDGVDDEVVIPYENNTFSVDFTWSAVIKPYTVDKDMMFMYGSTTAQYFRIQNGKLGASVRGQDSPVAYALTNFALEANTAYHVVVSHTNGDFKIYANGEQVGESDKGMKNERYRLSWLGKYTSADPRAFEGAILSAQVHNKALSAEEIAHNYAVEKEKLNIIEGEM